MAVTLSCFFYKTVLTATHSLLVLMNALSFASVVTNQEQVWQQVKLMMLHVVCKLRLVNEGVGSRINCIGYYVEINCQLDEQMTFIADLIACSTCFGHHYAHHQELEGIIQRVAACGIWCVGFQVVGMVWS